MSDDLSQKPYKNKSLAKCLLQRMLFSSCNSQLSKYIPWDIRTRAWRNENPVRCADYFVCNSLSNMGTNVLLRTSSCINFAQTLKSHFRANLKRRAMKSDFCFLVWLGAFPAHADLICSLFIFHASEEPRRKKCACESILYKLAPLWQK